MDTLYQIAKFTHICGFISAIGVTMASLITYNQFWKLYAQNREQGLASFRAFEKLHIAGMVGMLVIIIAGIIMLAIVHWSFTTLLWMQIKLGLVVLIFVNGLTLGRKSSMKLRKLIDPNEHLDLEVGQTSQLRKNLNLFFILQLIIYLVIIFLSVFRFT